MLISLKNSPYAVCVMGYAVYASRAMAICLLAFLAACSGSTLHTRESSARMHVQGAHELVLLHINDHHSHLDDTTIPLMLDTGEPQRERILVSAGGFARVTSAMKELAAKAGQPVIKIHAGDAITGDLYYTLSNGQADAELMNTVCFDSMTLGNHEFDNGDAALKRFLDYLRRGRCNTAVLSANVQFGAGSALSPDKAPGYVRPFTILERNGRRIGLIGITVADKTKNASRPDPDTVFADEAASAQAQIDALHQQGVEIIVLQTHYGYKADLALAQRLQGVDVIIGGDSHTLLGPNTLKEHGYTPMGPYPTLTTDRAGNTVCIAQAGQYAYVVGELRLNFDEAGRVQSCNGTPHVLIGDDFRPSNPGPPALAPHVRQSINADIERSGALRITPQDPEAVAVLAPYQARKLEFGASIVTQAEETLCARRVPGPRRDASRSSQGDACNTSARVDTHGGDIQQLVAQAYLQQASRYFKADIALINAGGVRVDIPAGPVTVKDIYTLLPFKNTLVQLKVPGSLLKSVLEEAVDAALATRPSTGAFPYAAGMRWQLDSRRTKGERLHRIEVRNGKGQYQALEPAQVYSVATIDFIADGKDHYTAFRQLKDGQRIDVGLDASQLFLDYAAQTAESGKGLRRLPLSHYSTQTFR